VEVAERVGQTVAYWRAQPFAFLLWTYRHLQELDRRRQWVERMQRVESAMFGAMGFHDPKLLDGERAKAVASARDSGPAPDDAVMDRVRVMAAELAQLGDANGAG
jgi:hypothetical protein